MTAEVLEHARQFGQQIKAIYAVPLAVIEPGQGGERTSCDTFELELPAEPFTHLEIMEDLQEGRRIAAYSIEVRRQGMWSELLSGLSVGHKRLHKLSPLPPIPT